MDVSIDSGRNANHTSRAVVRSEEFSQVDSISHSTSSSNYDKTSQSEVRANLKSLLLHLDSSKLVNSSSDEVVSSKVDIILEVFTCHDLVFVGYQTIDASDEANQLHIAS